MLFSAALSAPISRIYFARDYSRRRAHVLSGVIISFKCGALANPLDLSPRSVNLTFFLCLLPRLRSRPFYLSLLFDVSYFFLRSSSTIKLKKVLPSTSGPPIDPGRIPLLLPSPFFLLLSLYNVLAVLPATPHRLSRTLTRLLQLLRLRFPQDNR